MIVCHCRAVRDEEIRTEVRLGAETVELVATRCGATTKCGGCLPVVEAIIADEVARSQTALPARH
jgi:bacterioferritin-associated ferredoxin